ncbi:MAG TPA: hypothetical protein VN035_14955 [Microbacterium sp.]|nr:hypothetical protein [Microbacterium sp.]
MDLHTLNAHIERTERAAIAKAMCGRWTKADDEELAALYAERHRIYEEGTNHD